MKMTFSKKWIIGFVSLAPFVFAKTSSAQAPMTAAYVSANADNLSALRDACGVDSDIMEAAYHAETRTVDLSDFDGCSTVLRLEEAAGSHSPNGED